jgi:hypothetical protein
MNKRQLIEAIQDINPTATTRFLEQFDENSLQQYFNRLKDVDQRAPKINARVKVSRPEYLSVA